MVTDDEDTVNCGG